MKDDQGQQFEPVYGAEQIITYAAYKHTADKYELLYQCDESGNKIVDEQGNPNPNLSAQHREAAKEKSVVPVVKSGPAPEKKEAEVKTEVQSTVVVQTPEKKKPGPKRKEQELQEHTA